MSSNTVSSSNIKISYEKFEEFEAEYKSVNMSLDDQDLEESNEDFKNIKMSNVVFYDNEDFNLKDDLMNGQIYLIRNKINGKCYVGQATCFTGSNNNRWGTMGRWKSHIREALNSGKDHCTVLNNAIRKYGETNFEVFTLIKCNKDELDDNEINFVKMFNSVQPNGYNLKEGGYSSKNNPETILKMKEAHKDKTHTDETKDKIGKSQIGNRRNAKPRKYEEDNILPKYIIAQRTDGEIKRYVIQCFPIGTTTVEYLPDIVFSLFKYGSKEKALEEAIKHLDELKDKYKHIEEEVNNLKEENIKASIKEQKENKLKDKLPEYIYPIVVDNKISGYYVDNIYNNSGKKYPKRIFNENTNRWNLDKSMKFVEMLKYINEHNVDMSLFKISTIDINSTDKSFYEKYYLPKYVNVLRKKGNICGFVINGFPDEEYKDGKFKQEFQLKGKTMDATYKETINFLKNTLLKNLN